MVLLWLALLTATQLRSFTSWRLLHRLVLSVVSSVVRARRIHDDAAPNCKDDVEEVEFSRCSFLRRLGIDSLEKCHELATVQYGYLRIGVLEVQIDQSPAQLRIWEGRGLDSRL